MRRIPAFLGLLGSASLATVCFCCGFAGAARGDSYSPPPAAFDGNATELRATDMVPTLDTPLTPVRFFTGDKPDVGITIESLCGKVSGSPESFYAEFTRFPISFRGIGPVLNGASHRHIPSRHGLGIAHFPTFCATALEGDSYSSPPAAFDGNAAELRATDMVPTLDTPLTSGHSAVWCAGTSAMWKALEREVTHGPVKIEGGLPEADRLNAAPDPTNDLRPECLFADAGLVSQGIVERIRHGVAEKFPQKTLPTFPGLSPQGIVAYAFLEADVTFEVMYDENPFPLQFHGSDGTTVRTLSFGVPLGNRNNAKNPRILYLSDFSDPLGSKDCAIELDANPVKDQVVVAYTDGRGTIQEMYESVQRKIRAASMEDAFTYADTLEVPTIVFSVQNDFPTIVGKSMRLPDSRWVPIDQIMSKMKFRLDRKGAHVEEEVTLAYAGCSTVNMSKPRDFRFDRPFLLFMKKRDAERPYFVMYVANAELLCKWPAAPVQNSGDAK